VHFNNAKHTLRLPLLDDDIQSASHHLQEMPSNLQSEGVLTAKGEAHVGL